jgi:beta-lactamase regulating signal transducer with metallopeptidase domain
VLLPPAIARASPPAELRRSLLHEHHCRGDVPLNVLLVLAARLYWFHPLVAVALARLPAAQESTRDFEALALAREERDPLPYARTLLPIALEQPRSAAASALLFLPRESAIQGRIVMLTRCKKPSCARSPQTKAHGRSRAPRWSPVAACWSSAWPGRSTRVSKTS